MHINSTKTKVVHYRPKRVKRTSFNFRCGDQSINVCTKYKYLGLWFTEDLDFSYMAREVAAAAQRSLGLLIAKARCIGGLPFECYTKLYNSLVQPVIDYGVSIWGYSSFSCIEAVQNRAVRFFLGVHCKAPNTATQGDMGWKPTVVRQWSAITRQWCRYSRMENSRLNKHVFRWAANSKSKNWTTTCKKVYKEHNFEDMLNVDIPCDTSVARDIENCIFENYI